MQQKTQKKLLRASKRGINGLKLIETDTNAGFTVLSAETARLQDSVTYPKEVKYGK